MVGFALANLVGMSIVLLGIQLYGDVLPLFSGADPLWQKEYVVAGKRVSTLGSLMRNQTTFSDD